MIKSQNIENQFKTLRKFRHSVIGGIKETQEMLDFCKNIFK
jgi:D-arabinose 1-dehydrogenase-like Zn-dependent alcohol dehydrogenase